jgi:transcription initiation factor IIF auxiliary subunit
MLVVGYDDTKEAFKLMNSWGDDWGVDGFCWIDYNSFAQMINQSFVVLGRYKKDILPEINPSREVISTSIRPYGIREMISDNRYYFTYGLNFAEGISRRVLKVIYKFDHPSFANKYLSSTTFPNFKVSYNGWGCLKVVQAIVYLDDGKTVDLTFDGCEVLAVKNIDIDELNIYGDVKIDPTDERERYDFTISLKGIGLIREQISKVIYDRNHESFKQRYLTSPDPSNNFEVSWNGYGCLTNLIAVIYFKDGTNKSIRINMCKQIGWE